MEELNADKLITIFKLDCHEPTESENSVVIPADVDILKKMLNIGNYSHKLAQVNPNFHEDAVKLLIEHRLELNDLFLDCGDFFGLAGLFWDYVADKISERGFNTTGSECSKKWDQLYKQYMEIVENSSRSEAEEWKYFDDFERAFKARKESCIKPVNTEQALTGTLDHTGLRCTNKEEVCYALNGNNNTRKTEIPLKISDRQTTNVVTESEIEDAVQFMEELNNVQIESIENEMVGNDTVCPSSHPSETLHNNPEDLQDSRVEVVLTKSTDFPWDDDSNQCFLDLRLNIEKSLKAGHYNGPDPDVQISTRMALYGYQITVSQCEKKWHELMTLYNRHVESVKEMGDLMKTWKYLWQMDEVLKHPGLSGLANRRDFAWTKDAVLELIKIRLPMENAFVTFKKYITLWQHVAFLMTERNYEVSYTECSMKWSELYDDYENRFNTASMEDFYTNWDPLLDIHFGIMQNAIRSKAVIEYCSTNINPKNQSHIRHINSRTLSTNLMSSSIKLSILEEKEAIGTKGKLTGRRYVQSSTVTETLEGSSRDVAKYRNSMAKNVFALEVKRQQAKKEVLHIAKQSKKKRKSPRRLNSIGSRGSLKKDHYELNKGSEGTISDTLSCTGPNTDNALGFQLAKPYQPQNISAASQNQHVENHAKPCMAVNSSCSSKQSQFERTAASTLLHQNVSQVNPTFYEILQQRNINCNITESSLDQRSTDLSIANDKDSQDVFEWTSESTSTLIRLRLAWDSQFKIWGKERFYLWNKIAELMHSLGYNVSSFSCETQWIHLMSAYYSQYIRKSETMHPEYREHFELINAVVLNGPEGDQSAKVQIKALEPKDQKCLLGAHRQKHKNSIYVWTEEAVKIFLALKYSEECPDERTMQWVANKMQEIGYNTLTPALCTRKWQRMCRTYKNLIQRREHEDKPIKWPYFEKMERYFQKWGRCSKKRISSEINKQSFTWSKNAIQSLIKFRMSLDDSFRESDVREKLWQQITGMMIQKGFLVPPHECAAKWNSLMATYTKTTEDLQTGHGVAIGEHFIEIHEKMLNINESKAENFVEGSSEEPLDLSYTATSAYCRKKPSLQRCNETNNVICLTDNAVVPQNVTDSQSNAVLHGEKFGNARHVLIANDVSLKGNEIASHPPASVGSLNENILILNQADSIDPLEHRNSYDSLGVPQHESEFNLKGNNYKLILSKDVASSNRCTRKKTNVVNLVGSTASSCLESIAKESDSTDNIKNPILPILRDDGVEFGLNQKTCSTEMIEPLSILPADTYESGNNKTYGLTIAESISNSNDSLLAPHHNVNSNISENNCNLNLNKDVASSNKGTLYESNVMEFEEPTVGSCPKSTADILRDTPSKTNNKNCPADGLIPYKTFNADGSDNDFNICENANYIQPAKKSDYKAPQTNLTLLQARYDNKETGMKQKTNSSTETIKNASMFPAEAHDSVEDETHVVRPANISNSLEGTTDEQMISVPNKKSGKWSILATHVLIDFRVYHELIYPGCPKTEVIWSKIASQMKSAGYDYNSFECKRKWENLVNNYERKIRDMQSKKAMPVWPYFEKLDWIFKKSARYSNDGYIFIMPKNELNENHTTEAKKLEPMPKKRTSSSTSPFVSKCMKLE